jgi:hypothetical protein
MDRASQSLDKLTAAWRGARAPTARAGARDHPQRVLEMMSGGRELTEARRRAWRSSPAPTTPPARPPPPGSTSLARALTDEARRAQAY